MGVIYGCSIGLYRGSRGVLQRYIGFSYKCLGNPHFPQVEVSCTSTLTSDARRARFASLLAYFLAWSCLAS